MTTMFVDSYIVLLLFWAMPRTQSTLLSANNYVDSILNTALQYELQSSKMDPLALPDFTTEFTDHMAFIGKVHGKVTYTDGQLTGLSKAKRYSNCNGPVLHGYGIGIINCTVLMDDLKIHFNGKLKYGKLPSVGIAARANSTDTLLFVDIAKYPGSNIPVIRYFRFLQIGKVETNFKGLGSGLNKYLKILDKDFREHAWPAFFNAIGQGFQSSLGRAMARIPFPWY